MSSDKTVIAALDDALQGLVKAWRDEADHYQSQGGTVAPFVMETFRLCARQLDDFLRLKVNGNDAT